MLFFQTKLSLADDPQRIDSTTSGTDFVAHVTLEKQNTNVPPPPSNEEKGHLETTKTCNNNHVNNKVLVLTNLKRLSKNLSSGASLPNCHMKTKTGS